MLMAKYWFVFVKFSVHVDKFGLNVQLFWGFPEKAILLGYS